VLEQESQSTQWLQSLCANANLRRDDLWVIERPTGWIRRARNSYLHGEKFRGGPDGQWERDVTLIKEAHIVLQAALAWPSRANA